MAAWRPLARKTLVIYNGINLRKIDALKAREIRKELKIEKEAPLLGLVGILHPVKGIEILIKAAPIILEEFPAAKFLIIGDIMSQSEAGYLDRLKALVRELSLEGKVFFLGYQKEAPELIKSLDILVHPALYPEPLPRAVLEAAACRRPIVASSVGGLGEIIDDGLSGFLFKPGDVASLARHCLHLLKNRDLACQLGEQARQKIEEKFTIERHCQQIASLYEELIERGK
jgi:glycosyltransferase involved in cell wall biosynthesis